MRPVWNILRWTIAPLLAGITACATAGNKRTRGCIGYQCDYLQVPINQWDSENERVRANFTINGRPTSLREFTAVDMFLRGDDYELEPPPGNDISVGFVAKYFDARRGDNDGYFQLRDVMMLDRDGATHFGAVSRILTKHDLNVFDLVDDLDCCVNENAFAIDPNDLENFCNNLWWREDLFVLAALRTYERPEEILTGPARSWAAGRDFILRALDRRPELWPHIDAKFKADSSFRGEAVQRNSRVKEYL